MSRVDYERAATEPPPEASANGHQEPAGQAKAKTKKAKANVLSVDQLQTLSTSQVRWMVAAGFKMGLRVGW